MTRNRVSRIGLPLLLCVAVSGASSRAAEAPKTVPEWWFSVGVTYISGFKDVVDYHEQRFGESVDLAIPAGIQFVPYLQYDHGSRIELNAGPITALLAQVTVVEGFTVTEQNYSYVDVPVGLSYGFTFLPHASTSPYASAGFRFHFVSGDFTGSSSPGLFGAIGLELARKNKVAFGLELGFDGSEVTLEAAAFDVVGNPIFLPEQKIKTNNVTFSFRVIF